MALKSELKLQELVVVGARYEMAAHPPFAERGRKVPDEWTGLTLRIVGFYSDETAKLAMPAVVDANESDEVVAISCARLTPKDPHQTETRPWPDPSRRE